MGSLYSGFVEMSAPGKFCLKWDHFKENACQSYKDLRDESLFFDVTIACDDDFQIEAHKVVLSASSSSFKKILKRNQHSHPLIYMKGIKRKSIEAILDFIYYGEVNVEEEDLNVFLTGAQDLGIKGLDNRDETEDESENQPAKENVDVKREENDRYVMNAIDFMDDNYSVEETSVSDIISEAEAFSREESGVSLSGDDMIELRNGIFTCTKCDKSFSSKPNLRRHTEVHTTGVTHPCVVCGKTYSTKNSLQKHKYTYHK